MGEPFVGSLAVAAGMSWGELQRDYIRMFRDIYVHADTNVTAVTRAQGGWLWSGRKAVIAGLSAAAVHGSKWVDAQSPVEMLHSNRHRLNGMRIWGDHINEDEIAWIDGMAVTTPARTALDVACWHPRLVAAAAVDALMQATALQIADVEKLAERRRGRRGIVRARAVLKSADGGAQSPQETYLRLRLVDDGLPPLQTQIPVLGDNGSVVAYLDMGWEEIKVAVEYDGEQHRTSRSQYSWDVKRLEIAQRRGWIVVRVLAGDEAKDVLRRVRNARARRLALPAAARRPA